MGGWKRLAAINTKTHDVTYRTFKRSFPTAMAFSPDKTLLYVAGYDDNTSPHEPTITIWDTITFKCLRRMCTAKECRQRPLDEVSHTHVISSLAVSPDGTRLYSGSFDGTVRVWDTTTRTCLRCLTHMDNRVHSIQLSLDGRYLHVGGNAINRDVYCIYDTTTFHVIKVPIDIRLVHKVVLSPDGRWVYLTCQGAWKNTRNRQWGDGIHLQVYDAITHTCLYIADTTHYEGDFRFVLSPDGRWLYTSVFVPNASVSAPNASTLLVYDTVTFKRVMVSETIVLDQIRSISLSPDGRWLHTIGRDSSNHCDVWDMQEVMDMGCCQEWMDLLCQ